MKRTSKLAENQHFTVSDGRIVLFRWPQPEGGYTITSPMDDRLISEAETLEEAIEQGHDALGLLRDVDPSDSRRAAAAGAKRAVNAVRRRKATRAS